MKKGKVSAAYERLRGDFARIERWIADSEDEYAAVIRNAVSAIELRYVADRTECGYGSLFDASKVRCGDGVERLVENGGTHLVTIVSEAISSLSYASVYDYLGEVRSECIALGLMLGRFSCKVIRLNGRAVIEMVQSRENADDCGFVIAWCGTVNLKEMTEQRFLETVLVTSISSKKQVSLRARLVKT